MHRFFNILLTTIKFKTYHDYLVKFKDFKAVNLVQSDSRLFKTQGPVRTLIKMTVDVKIIKMFVFG